MSEDGEPPLLLTRRAYLLIRALEAGAAGGNDYVTLTLAREAVASTALAHPDWDMSEVRTLAEWEREA